MVPHDAGMASQPIGEDRMTSPTRITDVDALRGFALGGILFINIGAFASAYFGTGVLDPAFSGPLDQLARWLVSALFEAKFYLLFSFLFGYSFTLQVIAAQRAGAEFLPRMLRRLGGLALLGGAHALLLFHGDILLTYALLGLILVALRHRPQRQLVELARMLVLLTALFWALIAALQWLDGEQVDVTAVSQAVEQAHTAYRSSPTEVIEQHWHELSSAWIVFGLMLAPCALAMFLLGLVAGRKRMLERQSRHRALQRHMLRAGLCIGLPGAVCFASAELLAPGSAWETLGMAVNLFSAPLLAAAYLVLALRVFHSRVGRRLGAMLAPAGRMALSNYLLQSLFCSLVFTAYGLGLIGRVSPSATLLLAAAIFTVQLLLSHLWLSHFAYGPAEWLLRALTIGAWPRLLRRDEAVRG